MSVGGPTVTDMAGEILDPRTDLGACALVLRHLQAHEADWRRRVGDDDYEESGLFRVRFALPRKTPDSSR